MQQENPDSTDMDMGEVEYKYNVRLIIQRA